MSEEYRYYIAIEHILGGLKYQTDEEVEQIIRRLKQTDGESWACGETLERLLTVRRAWANPKTEVEFEILSTYDKIQEENERLREAVGLLRNWVKAYPLDMFPEPDLKLARKLLTDGGVSYDALNVYSMRHVINGVGRIIDETLNEVTK